MNTYNANEDQLYLFVISFIAVDNLQVNFSNLHPPQITCARQRSALVSRPSSCSFGESPIECSDGTDCSECLIVLDILDPRQLGLTTDFNQLPGC